MSNQESTVNNQINALDTGAENAWKEMFKGTLKVFRYLVRKWPFLLLAGALGAASGVLIARLTPVTYTADMKFILEEGKSSGGSFSSIASSLGFDVGNAGGSMLAGDNIIGLLKSRRFTTEVLLTAYDEKNKSYSLADRYADVYELRPIWKNNKKIGKDIFFPVEDNITKYTRVQDSLLQGIVNAILKSQLNVARPDKKMSFFSVTASFEEEHLSKLYVERLVKSAVDFYVETKTRRLRNNVDRLQSRSDSLLRTLNTRTYTAAVAQSRSLDINPAYQAAGVAVETGIRDKTVVATIYAEVVKNLEIQKLNLTQETPTIQIVDDVELPLKRNRTSTISYALGFGSLLVMIASVWLLGKKYLSKSSKSSSIINNNL